MENIVSVIQLIVVMVHVVVYVHIWPIRRLGTTKEYRNMIVLTVIVVVFMVVTQAPAGVYTVYLGVILKDIFMMIVSWRA